ncbi:C40 family peptidase [Pseudoroseicyclus tamaricis]|uniref:C40 family peptidase n=1 Tax=Pseudoroseicyclus tamaricis TaxID=2705421 RepID=A0A6B2K6U6_9RHOB|nr:C40 family peptidase [Pseudoroseicyclus tamaricis]NDV02656.1 C40 family peptidase [Pseudoroseicyclus tamaricis]
MSDPRLHPANGRVAHVSVGGEVEGTLLRVLRPVTGLMSEGGRARLRELVFGEGFVELERRDGWSFGMAARDGYVGYLRSEALGDGPPPTHRVRAARTYALPVPALKAPDAPLVLPFGAQVTVLGTAEDSTTTWAEIAGPVPLHLPLPHLAPLDAPEADPVEVAERLSGTPYLWGGNSTFGIDCSGLVQAALLACGIPCPGDSDLQEALGAPATGPHERGDLIFWRGHVAIALDESRMIHANGHHMEVAVEPIAEAEARIAAKGGGPVTARRRL